MVNRLVSGVDNLERADLAAEAAKRASENLDGARHHDSDSDEDEKVASSLI